ncbi:MAG: glycosyltransferase [Phycisphaerales bacterium]|nr:glycosyltransferase [Phycisphaerales bacterium]
MTDRPLRIVQHIDHFRFAAGGVCRTVSDLCTLLAARGHDVTLVTLDDTDVPAAWRSGGPGLPRAVNLPRVRRADAGRLLRGADSLHLHGMWTLSNIPLARAAHRMGVPYVFSPHGMLDDWCMAQRGLKKRVFMRAIGRRMLDRAALVHCETQGEMDQARKWYGGGHGFIAPPFMDLSLYRTPPGPGPARAKFPQIAVDGPLLLFLSRVHPKKGLGTLIRAAALLRERGVPVRVAAAGTGEPDYVEELRRLAAGLGIGGHVHFLGMVGGAEKVSLYQAADVFVLPTHQENFGLVLYESLAAGTPVVTTRAVDPWRELEATGGAVTAENTPEAMAGAAAAILRDPGLRGRMGASGRDAVLKQQEGEHLCRVYESMLAPRSAADATHYTPAGASAC